MRDFAPGTDHPYLRRMAPLMSEHDLMLLQDLMALAWPHGDAAKKAELHQTGPP